MTNTIDRKVSEVKERRMAGADMLQESTEGSCGGSPDNRDLVALWCLCESIRPSIIAEIGTWIGTTAEVMHLACGANIHTCDMRNYYKDEMKGIAFYHMKSTDMLRELITNGVKTQMCFIDANLRDADPFYLRELFSDNPPIIAVHDMNIHNGRDNMKLLLQAIGNIPTKIIGDTIGVYDARK